MDKVAIVTFSTRIVLLQAAAPVTRVKCGSATKHPPKPSAHNGGEQAFLGPGWLGSSRRTFVQGQEFSTAVSVCHRVKFRAFQRERGPQGVAGGRPGSGQVRGHMQSSAMAQHLLCKSITPFK